MSFRQVHTNDETLDSGSFGIDHKILSYTSADHAEEPHTGRTRTTDNSTVNNTSIVEVPMSLQSMITQTDASGNAIRRDGTGVDLSTDSTAQVKRAPSNSFAADNRLSRFFCYCISREKPMATLRTRNPPNTTHKTTSDHSLVSIAIPTTHFRPSFRSSLAFANRPLPVSVPDIGEISPQYIGKKLLALDLDETLVHSSFQPVPNANYIIPVNIDGMIHNVFVIKRPGVDEFLRRLSEYYELVVYTASLSKYADPLLDELDKDRLISMRLFRENCVFYNGHYVKDLSLFTNRDISQTIIIDNSPMSYIFQPDNAIDCTSFIDSPHDIEMWQIADFLIAISNCEDVRKYCRRWREWCRQHPSTITQ